MKKLFFLLFISAAFSFYSCSESDNIEVPVKNDTQQSTIETTRSLFAEDDGSKALNGTPSEVAKALLDKVPVTDIKTMTDTLGRANITDAQYIEIQEFARELTNGLTTDKEKYDACFKWITENIKYEYSDNDPYPVFKNRKGICQGYSNLLFIMMHSLDVPAFVCNGQINVPPYGGHAWNYVYCDDRWYVSDPTNKGSWSIEKTSEYNWLLPSSFDVVLYKKDGVSFNYYEYKLNICSVESGDNAFTVPFSVNDIQVSMFCPTTQLPDNIKELYIGQNITSFGEGYMGLSRNAPNVEFVEVDPANKTFSSYIGAVYMKAWDGSLQLYYIPSNMKYVELLPMETIYKNTLYNLNGVETVVVAPGTKSIENWAFENCPNLKIAYIPEGVEIAESAFQGVHSDFQIIRGDYTCVPEIKAE